MAAAPLTRYLLDTNILVHYTRGADLAIEIETRYSLRTSPISPIISIVTVGELRSFALQNSWGRRKLDLLDQLLNDCIVVQLDLPGLVESYAKIDTFSVRQGRAMGKNDVWIAATAAVTKTLLLTTDKDFDHLHPNYIQRDWIDPATKLGTP